ncbi:hypothetical protein EII34_07190 [Arachnia propionica]|uniref:Uncharacterized protein n=1 Tax=Arachnia propionica TaxID=1750 RepID=A0A3P1T7P3_9ACTN|nr:hypothetical protein [Arachnia propionica]MDO5083212.1 hypothetical protein [Arachnia propionica]RRD05507.1 hypothetical protein EII34_07190 [Arachnia propionica]
MGKFRLRAAVAAMAAASLVMTAGPAQAEVPTGVAEAPSYNPVSPWHVQNMIDDMTLPNDGTVAGQYPYFGSHAGWAEKARVVMGNIPKGSNAPDYWRDAVISGKYKYDTDWKALQPWIAIFTLSDNQATNTRVEVSSIRAYILSKKTNQWELFEDHPTSGGIFDEGYAHLPHVQADERQDGGFTLVKPPAADARQIYHSWGEPKALKDPSDIKAVHVRVFTRLVLDDPNGPDDRHLAKYALQVGADYYPEVGSTVNDADLLMKGQGKWFPGVGISRAVQVTNEQRLTSFTTLDAAVQEPGGSKNPNGSLNVEEFRKNPPPF